MSMHLLFVATTDQDQDETQGKAIRTSLAEALGQDIQFHFQRYTDQQGLLPFYSHAQDLASEAPCLLLFEGEDISDFDILKNHLDQGIAAPVYAQLEHPEHLELAPRLFHGETIQLVGTRFISEPQLPHEHVPLQIRVNADCVYTQHFDLQKTAPETTEDLLFFKAFKHFKALHDSAAREGFQSLMEQAQHPFWRNLSQVMYLKTLWEMHDYQHCFEELERLRHHNDSLENFPALWILRGIIAQQFQAIDTAFDCFAMVETLSSRGAFALQHLFIERPDITWKPLLGSAELALKEGLYPRAVQGFKAAAQYLPDHDYVLSGWLQSAFLTRRYNEVTAILERETPLRGVSDLARKSLHAMTAIKHAPQAPETWVAVEILLSADNVDPFTLSIWVELAILCLQHQQLELARQFLLHTIRYQPKEVMLWHNLAYTYFSEKDYANAEKYYRQALTVSPHYPNSQFDLAKTLVMQERQAEAITVLQDLLTVHPRFHEAEKALKELEALQAFDAHAVIPPALPRSAAPRPPSLDEAPFVFAFPVAALWQHGIDVLLKAYYEEFVPSDNVVLAIPLNTQEVPEAIENARAWALENFEESLLPPVALLDESLPLIPGHACWVLPWRIQPSDAFLEAFQQQPYPVLMPAPLGSLKTLWELDPQDKRAWQAVSTDELRQALRVHLETSRRENNSLKGPVSIMASTHDLLNTSQPTAPLESKISNTRSPEMPHADSLLEEAPRIGVCMIVKNEEKVIEKAIESVRNTAAEIIVVDTGSTDSTLEKLQQYPEVQIHHFEWCDDFAAARNAAFEQSGADWVLFLDADEYVSEDFIPRLRLTLNQHEADAYCFKVLSVTETGDIDDKSSLGGVPRLFPNTGDYRFEGKIHEVVYHRTRDKMQYVYPKNLPIYHVGYRPDVIAAKAKGNRDRELMLSAIREAPDARSTKRLYSILARDFWNTQEPEKAFQYLNEGLAQSPDDARVYDQLFYQQQSWRLETGDIDIALQSMAERNDQSSRFCFLWAQLYMAKENTLKAFKKVKEALYQWDLERNQPDPLELRPQLEDILSLLVDICQQLEKPKESLHFLARYLKENKSAEPKFWKRYEQLLSQVAPLQF